MTFPDTVEFESRGIGALADLDGVATVEASVPGAQLINGCIGFRQTVEPLIRQISDELSQLYPDIHGGIATVEEADAANAAAIGEACGE
uniref:hypothetical protein n=1 Tax=Dietzia sp. oral taxon 368 TaxID=712270 RepID=UPI00101AD0B0|nr:hypothetical protein [Dietzia sp. oral taxon 368]